MALVHLHLSSGVEKFISISMGNYLGNRGLICSGEVRGKSVWLLLKQRRKTAWEGSL